MAQRTRSWLKASYALGLMTMSCGSNDIESVDGAAENIVSDGCTPHAGLMAADCTLLLDEPVVGWGAAVFTNVEMPTSAARTVAAVLARSRSHGDYYGVGAYLAADGGEYGDRVLTNSARAVVMGAAPISVDVVPIVAGPADGGYYLQYRAFDAPTDLQAGGMLTIMMSERDMVYARQVSLPPNQRVRVMVDLAAAGHAAVLLAESETYGRSGIHLLSSACEEAAATAQTEVATGYSCEESARDESGWQVLTFWTSAASWYDFLVLRSDYIPAVVDVYVDVS